MPSWKKIITSGSDALLSSVTTTGNISGSSTSTGSFGYIETAGAGNVALFGDSALADEYIAVRATTNGAMFGIDASLNSGNGGVLISGGTNKSFAIKVADSSGFGAGTPEFTIDTSGNVDITSGYLKVAAGATGEYFRVGGDDNSNQRGLRFTSATTTYTGDTHTINAPSAGGNIVFQTNSTERLRIDNSGNVKVSGDIRATGDVIAENYIVSSSVTYMTQSFSSGSTVFGDTSSDTHIFTGSLQISGGLQVDNGNLKLNNANGDVDIRNFADGAMNVVIGDSTTGAALSSGTDNVIIGQGIAAIQTGENNVYIGAGAAAANNAVNNNVAIGYQALVNGNNNANNVAIGFRSIYGNNSSNSNTAVGYESGKGTTTGGENAFFGFKSGDTNTTGEQNVTLGAYADVTGTGASNQIAIGYNVTSTGDNQTVIGNSDQTHVVFGGDALISGSAASTGSFGSVHTAGKVGIGTASPKGTVHIQTADGSGYQAGAGADDLIVENNGDAGITITGPNANTQKISFGSTSTDVHASIKASFDGDLMSVGTSNVGADLRFLTGNNSEAVRILDSGYVGIGTTNPSAPLTITTDTSPAMIIEDAAGHNQFQFNINASNGAELQVNDGGGTERIRLSARSGGHSYITNAGAGYFGIGTTSPTHMLDIYGGSDNATGGIKMTNDDTGTGATDGTTLMVEQNSGRFIIRQYEDANVLIRTNDTDAIEIDNSQVATFSGNIISTKANGLISGSSTSTGSFGLLQTTDRIAAANNDLKIKGNLTLDGVNIPELHLDGLVDAIVRIDKGASYRTAYLRFDTAGSGNWYIGTPDSDNYGDGDELYFGTSADTPIVAIDPNTSTGLLNLTSNKISGSSSSTGSFGVLQLSKYNQGIGDVGSTVFGVDAAKPGMSGTENTAIGSNALTDITSGAGNTALGREAAMNVSTGGENVAIGKLSLSQASTPSFNVAVGNEALRLTTTGGSNVGVGRESGYSGTRHSGSVYLGEQAGYSVTTGNQNIAIGHNAINGGTTTGDNNIAIGANAGDALTSGAKNVFIGLNAGSAEDVGSNNIGIGPNALAVCNNDTGANVAIGNSAGLLIVAGYSNTLVGNGAGSSLTGGLNNILLGRNAQASAVGGTNQIVLGKDAAGHGNNIAVIGNTDCTAWHPADDNGVDLGSASYRFSNLYVADVQMSNEGTDGNEIDGTTGNWTIQEGEDDLYLLNRKNGKKYRFKLEEIK